MPSDLLRKAESRQDGGKGKVRHIKTGWAVTAAALLLLMLSVFPCAAEKAEEEPQDEWTVMFYFCGADLESKYSYASGDLNDIWLVSYPDNYLPLLLGADPDSFTRPGKVNVLIETGGSREWHAEAHELTVDSSALQRWKFNVYPYETDEKNWRNDGYELMETLPLQSMADPQTLSDFIRWGTTVCPAKKYALVLWGHGEGAGTGLLVDELFDHDIMYLYELRQALEDAGEIMEALVIDACLMSSIETAWSVREYARWMIASEENVPGKGSAVENWLQYLLEYPECDGEWLGRCICDTTGIKYANEAEEEAKSILTWSVTDLSKIEPLTESIEKFFSICGKALKERPEIANFYMNCIFAAPEYGDGAQNMRELGSMMYGSELAAFMDLNLRNEILKSLSDAVVYSVRGSGRSEARGLTFCYPANFSDEQMEIYSRNFPMPYYLAYIDAILPWSAPDWVYETAERLPSIDDIQKLQISYQKKVTDDGMPCLYFGKSGSNVDGVYYRLYRVDGEGGGIIRLGRTDCVQVTRESVDEETIWRAADPMHWPAINGVPVCIDHIQTQFNRKLYNIPVMIDGEKNVLRCGRTVIYPFNVTGNQTAQNEYEIYGVWEGYEETTLLLNRSVRPLSDLEGQEYCLLYPVDETADDLSYKRSETLTMRKRLIVEEIPLPAGTYYLEYEIDDVFMRTSTLGRIRIEWDGVNITFPDISSWESEDWTVLRRNGG